jgi:hypothetical protein
MAMVVTPRIQFNGVARLFLLPMLLVKFNKRHGIVKSAFKISFSVVAFITLNL